MDIGLEIKLLRERKGISGKELAQRVGLSQSQVSRIEKGQRRVNTETLHTIAEALEVNPAEFFQREDNWQDVNLTYTWREIGKMIKKERHKRHISLEEFAQKLGKTKGFAQGLEEGRYSLTRDLQPRVIKALKLDPYFLIECHRNIIARMKERIHRLETAHAEVTLGSSAAPKAGQAIPVMGGFSGEYPTEFDEKGLPVDTVNEYVFVSALEPGKCFALYARGSSMTGEGRFGFQDGDILIFSTVERIRNQGFAFVRAETVPPVFRQVFLERDGRVRLQPLNLAYAPSTCPRDEIISMWPLAAQIKRF